MLRSKLVTLSLLLSSLVVSAAAAVGPEFVEGDDAPSLGNEATPVFSQFGPVANISGRLGGAGITALGGLGDFEDLYIIQIDDPDNFSATTSTLNGGQAEFDSALFLFSIGSDGIIANLNDQQQNITTLTGGNQSPSGPSISLDAVQPRGNQAAGGPVGWDEIPDAGSLPDDAQPVVGAEATPVAFINGEIDFDGDLEDMYVIRISDPAAFVADTNLEGFANFDSTLYLFNLDGTGLLANDDAFSFAAGGGFGSRLTSPATDGSGAEIMSPGFYLLAISSESTRPVSGEGDLIFNFEMFTEVSGPDGPGGGSPLNAWQSSSLTADSGKGFGLYSIALSGVDFISEGSSTLVPNSTDGSGAMVNMPGLYLLGVSSDANRPRSPMGDIFMFDMSTEISGPDGPGGSEPLNEWDSFGAVTTGGFGTGEYLIQLTGVGSVPAGACCRSDGSCFETIEMFCNQQGGTFQGVMTTCSPNPCAPPTTDLLVQSYIHNGNVAFDGFEALHTFGTSEPFVPGYHSAAYTVGLESGPSTLPGWTNQLTIDWSNFGLPSYISFPYMHVLIDPLACSMIDFIVTNQDGTPLVLSMNNGQSAMIEFEVDREASWQFLFQNKVVVHWNGSSVTDPDDINQDGTPDICQGCLLENLPPSSDVIHDSLFGFPVKIDGFTAIVGAFGDNPYGLDAGAAYIYTRDNGGWHEQAQLRPTASPAFDGFGLNADISNGMALVGTAQGPFVHIFEQNEENWNEVFPRLVLLSPVQSIAIDGNIAVIGGVGYAEVFRYDGAGWFSVDMLYPPDPIDTAYGLDVAVDGHTILVSDPFTEDGGTVYAYDGDGMDWSLTDTLTIPGLNPNARFGNSIGLSGDRALIGAPLAGQMITGAGYVFESDNGGWMNTATLVAPMGNVADLFGWNVDLDGGTGVIGAPLADPDGVVSAGCAYLHQLDDMTGQWETLGKLSPCEPQINGVFGNGVGISGGLVLIGEPRHDNGSTDSGAAYSVFINNTPVAPVQPAGPSFTALKRPEVTLNAE